MKGQHDIARRERLNRGCCPTHGVALVQTGVALDDVTNEPVGDRVACPRAGCPFFAVVKPGTKLWKALHS